MFLQQKVTVAFLALVLVVSIAQAKVQISSADCQNAFAASKATRLD